MLFTTIGSLPLTAGSVSTKEKLTCRDSEGKPRARVLLLRPLEQQLSRDHVIHCYTHIHGKDPLQRSLAAGLEASRKLAQISVNPLGDASKVVPVRPGFEQLGNIVRAEFALPHCRAGPS